MGRENYLNGARIESDFVVSGESAGCVFRDQKRSKVMGDEFTGGCAAPDSGAPGKVHWALEDSCIA